MKVIVIGSGLIGLTTAYFLSAQGDEVTVVDRASGPGLETSFANGALLTPSMSQPWNAPGSWRVLLASLVRSDSPLQLRWCALPSLASWGLSYLRNSRTDRFTSNALSNVQLALLSIAKLHELQREAQIRFGRRAAGSLRIFRDEHSLKDAAVTASALARYGLRHRSLSSAQTIEIEPALEPIASRLAGGVYYESDELGDAHRFCTELAQFLLRTGVQLLFNTQIISLEKRGEQVTAVRTRQGCLVADRYVIAAGSYSTPLLKTIDIDLPVRPAKGYSLTFEREPAPALSIPIIDDQLHAVVVPLEGAIRVAGSAEFAGYDLTMSPARVHNLVRLLRAVLPKSQWNPANGRAWCGLRPMSADGVPIVGVTPLRNLFINTGHGHLGWTLAAGSAKLLAQIMSATSTSLDPVPYSLARFYPC